MGDFLDFASEWVSEWVSERKRKRMRLKLLEGPPSVAKHELHIYINNVYKLIN